MAKLWAGRFGKETDLEVNDFNSSISFDCRLYKEDITGSMAHAAMLGKQGIIAEDEADRITEGLQGILQDIENGTIEFSQEYEDIHMNVEHILTERIGDAGKRLHTARSRNDQVALDLRLYVKKEIAAIKGQVLQFMKALCGSAKKNTETVMPGYTHLQRAQPVTFGHYMMAYANMMKRDVIRLENCLEGMDDMPLGSGALASTTYPIDRDFVRERLGFARITDNSLDGVSDRDYCVELCSALSILMMHLSRFSEEIIAWCSWEFKFVELDDAFSTGSSIMPQKKNPDVCELVRGKTGRVYGSLFTLLTALKGLPLAYNKDMQEDKEAVFDAIDTVKQCLRVLTPMFATMELRKDNMERAALKGFINATDCADYLTKKGMPFRDAYKTVGRLVGECVKRDCALSDLTLPELRAHSELFEADVYEAIDLKTCVRGRKAPGGPAPEEVSRQIAAIEAFIGKREE
ncbi:argininosuccinate lyase [Otoolea muris]|uniref:argininosuccinate lyase n=1 Tax=Otoolea muris TaxID=2941515 RepID=UPI00203E4D34|nr:argininosuccinate lyase [Otoolea muris]